jgi:hypothetical protein
MADTEPWPSLPLAAWKDTYATLHMWTQIAGKIRLALTPWINHSWHVTLYVTARGLTTSPMACGTRTFQVDFDFIDHRLLVQTDEGAVETVALRPRSVADFHDELFAKLRRLGIAVHINTTPNEVVDATPFERDHLHAAYDAEYARRCWRALVQAHRVLTAFRAEFLGKCSPVHFFWGSFDLAVTRFSGRTAPPHPGGVPHLPDRVAREAYSHEVASCGFWPGNDAVPYAAFYAYAYPEPAGYAAARVGPAGARYDGALHEFVLPYDDVRSAADPDATLLAFCRSTYAAAADLGRWDRAALEVGSVPRMRAD